MHLLDLSSFFGTLTKFIDQREVYINMWKGRRQDDKA